MQWVWKLLRSSSLPFCRCADQFSFQIFFKSRQLGWDRLIDFEPARQGVRSFRAIAGDAEHGRLFRPDSSLRIELAGCPYGDASGCFGEDAFGLGQQGDGVYDLRIARIFGPATAA